MSNLLVFLCFSLIGTIFIFNMNLSYYVVGNYWIKMRVLWWYCLARQLRTKGGVYLSRLIFFAIQTFYSNRYIGSSISKIPYDAMWLKTEYSPILRIRNFSEVYLYCIPYLCQKRKRKHLQTIRYKGCTKKKT